MITKYYDKIYSKKDYSGEVDCILWMIDEPKNILDVGCGTGNHTIQFLKRGYDVLGIDTDPDMIDRALRKDKRFKCCDISDLPYFQYDLVTAMFNVVNYIDNLEQLLKFFRCVHFFTRKHFIFDCWNGMAAILDKPHKEVKRIENITITLEPYTNLIDQTVEMKNKIHIDKTDYIQDDIDFEYTYKQTLWTPKILRELLEMVGFDVHMMRWMMAHRPVTENDWKMMVKCDKR